MILEILDNNCRIVRPMGNIDMSNVQDFDAALDRAVRASPRGFVVDLSETAYIDSAGLKAILAAYLRLSRAGGSLAAFVRGENIKQLFDLVQLSTLPGFIVSSDLESAKRAVS